MTKPEPVTQLSLDASVALSVGRREYQEDAVVADFPCGSDGGFAVLADGMGGHAAGDIASKLVVTEVFSELMFRTADPDEFEAHSTEILTGVAYAANECLKSHVEKNPDTHGMGATLVAPVIFGSKLFWVSVGDSPLYLFRGGILEQINEDHSMAPQIDLMAASGMLDPEVARNHPDRNALTSVIFGEAIAQIDCPSEPLELHSGDMVVLASDGLQFLSNDEIAALLKARASRPSADIAQTLLTALERLEDPDQDNISICVIKVSEKEEAISQRPPPPAKKAQVQKSSTTRLISMPKMLLKPAAFAWGGK
ncbi:MAG: protein phosphatase 2C domain-containing protein [Pseudomonadota bacterium]